MFNIGPPELLVVLLIALVVVGPKRLPEIGRQVGRALHDLRKVQTEVKDAIRFDLDAEDQPPTKRASWSPAEVKASDVDEEERARSKAAGERAEQRAAERAEERARRTAARTPAPAEAGEAGDATRKPREDAPGDVADGRGAPPSPNGSTSPHGEPG